MLLVASRGGRQGLSHFQTPDKATMMKMGNEDPRQVSQGLVPSCLDMDMSATLVQVGQASSHCPPRWPTSVPAEAVKMTNC